MTQIPIRSYDTHRLVKSEDLNHHGTLFAGRSAEWFVEAGFVAASSLLNPKYLICLKIHGMKFSKPVLPGETVCFTSKIVFAGRTSLVGYIRVTLINKPEQVLVDGFVTFVHVDENTRPQSHNIEILAVTTEDIDLQQKAIALKNESGGK
jgi:acyl-CoA hydrolase